MDYLNAGWTAKLIPGWLRLTEEQLNAALSYIEKHRSEVEAKYQTVLQTSEELREYWEEKIALALPALRRCLLSRRSYSC
jgi:hypothetical protein